VPFEGQNASVQRVHQMIGVIFDRLLRFGAEVKRRGYRSTAEMIEQSDDLILCAVGKVQTKCRHCKMLKDMESACDFVIRHVFCSLSCEAGRICCTFLYTSPIRIAAMVDCRRPRSSRICVWI
jgi:hypothetical protein